MTAPTTSDIARGEARMLIDGVLTDAASGARYDNVGPATEQVIGDTADAGAADVDRAIAAARTAFDGGIWATDREFHKYCLRQLREALQEEKEAFRAEWVAEAGSPVSITYMAQLDWQRSRSVWSRASCRGTFRSKWPSTRSDRALAAGNTVVLKSAPDTPWGATRVGRLVAEPGTASSP
nr:aldehyde dehydrogenase family protein [Nocardia nova]